MAIIRPGPLIGAISGNLGALNFANARGVTIMRRRPTRTKPSSQKQLERQARYITFARQWPKLTSDQQDAWRTQAKQVPWTNKLGKPYYLSGFQTFMAVALSQNHEIDSPPALPRWSIRPTPPMTMSPDFTAGGPHNITLFCPPVAWWWVARLYLSRTMSTTIPHHYRSWTYASYHVYYEGSYTQDWESRILLHVGTLIQGEVVGLKMHLQHVDSLLSTPLIQHTTLK